MTILLSGFLGLACTWGASSILFWMLQQQKLEFEQYKVWDDYLFCGSMASWGLLAAGLALVFRNVQYQLHTLEKPPESV